MEGREGLPDGSLLANCTRKLIIYILRTSYNMPVGCDAVSCEFGVLCALRFVRPVLPLLGDVGCPCH